MDLGFGPRFSRVAAGVCLMLLLGSLEYLVGSRRILAVLISLLALILFLSLLLPGTAKVKMLAGRVARSLDVLRAAEWLENRFEHLTKR
jgi:hypothetical protein